MAAAVPGTGGTEAVWARALVGGLPAAAPKSEPDSHAPASAAAAAQEPEENDREVSEAGEEGVGPGGCGVPMSELPSND